MHSGFTQVKLSVFVDGIIVYIENLKESTIVYHNTLVQHIFFISAHFQDISSEYKKQ